MFLTIIFVLYLYLVVLCIISALKSLVILTTYFTSSALLMSVRNKPVSDFMYLQGYPVSECLLILVVHCDQFRTKICQNPHFSAAMWLIYSILQILLVRLWKEIQEMYENECCHRYSRNQFADRICHSHIFFEQY